MKFAVENQEGTGDKLPDGRLQFWQLFNYKTEYHYRIWEKEEFEAVILDRLLSGGTKKHSLAALNWVIKGVKLWLSSQEARDHFMKNRLVSQKHLPNVEERATWAARLLKGTPWLMKTLS